MCVSRLWVWSLGLILEGGSSINCYLCCGENLLCQILLWSDRAPVYVYVYILRGSGENEKCRGEIRTIFISLIPKIYGGCISLGDESTSGFESY